MNIGKQKMDWSKLITLGFFMPNDPAYRYGSAKIYKFLNADDQEVFIAITEEENGKFCPWNVFLKRGMVAPL